MKHPVFDPPQQIFVVAGAFFAQFRFRLEMANAPQTQCLFFFSSHYKGLQQPLNHSRWIRIAIYNSPHGPLCRYLNLYMGAMNREYGCSTNLRKATFAGISGNIKNFAK